MPVTFRAARAADVDSIVDSYARPHAEGMIHRQDAARVASWLDDKRTRTFVVERDAAVAAFVLVVMHETWLCEIANVVSTVPRTGAGWFALRETLRYAFDEAKVHRVYLEVVAANVPARALYEAAGLSLEGTWRDGYRREDGTYHDLCAYGILESEYRTRVDSRESPGSR
jgi:RimJ/RimL family protein N-acetyltransferase